MIEVRRVTSTTVDVVPLPMRAALIRRRNVEALRRLAYLAESGAR